ncbi:MAG: HEAT repeat domain-containing protein [Anaerolineaceae bacterium]|nr:HEAT repeat domain-containing protein [Anaerolineaceae bacterium]
MTRYLYLSYHNYDTEFALQLAADLKNNGVSLWMDRLDIPDGADWGAAVHTATQDMDGIIVILSPDYVNTLYCQAELDAARRAKRQIFWVVVRKSERDYFPGEAYSIVDFSAWRTQADYTVALGNLLKAFPDDYKGEAPPWETCYLISMIAELETRRSFMTVIETPVSAAPTDTLVRPPSLSAVFRWPMSFSLMVDAENGTVWDASEYVQRSRIKLDSIYDAVEKHPRFILLGDAGGGKTTALRLLALEAARKRLHDPENTPLPFLLYLPVWDTEPSFMDFAHQWWPGTGLAEWVEQGNITLFLDGLNEMGASGKRKVAKLREWLGAQPAIHSIITCRTGDYAGDLDMGLPMVIAEPMTPDQVRTFAQHYLGEQTEAFLKQLGAWEHNERALTSLAETPYLLSALVAVFHEQGMLPGNVGMLFRRLAQIVWEQPILKHMSGWIPFEEMESAFSALAYAMVRQDRPMDVPNQWALRQLSGRHWWQKVDHTLMSVLWVAHRAHLVEIRGRQMRFYHRLIQEYFAAVKLQESGVKSVLARPDFYLGRIAGKWDQVIIALCGLVEDAEAVIEEVIPLDPWLALDCIHSGIRVSSKCYERLLNELYNRMLAMDWPVRRAAVRVLGEIGDPAAIPALVMHGLVDSDWPVRRTAATALGNISVSDVVSGLIEALQDENYNVRQAATDALGAVGVLAVPALAEKLADTDYPWRSNLRICDYAAEALKKIDTPEAHRALTAWQETVSG